MELPSFYRTFAKNILRQCVSHSLWKRAFHRGGNACLMVLLVVLNTAGISHAYGAYSQLQLKQEVANFLAQAYKQIPHERISIDVGNLDNRVSLSRCTVPIEFTAQDPTGLGGNISVKAQCPGHPKWTLWVPAIVTVYQEIPVAVQDIPRGQMITKAHLTQALINISTVRQSFLADSQAIVGQEAKRNIGKGEVFRTAQLDSPTAVKRGDTVILESISGSIKVSSSGTAMTDGRMGQKIRVKNESSDRVITGVVKAQGLVQTF